MFNLSTLEVVLSIEKSPILRKNGIIYQEYHNFFGNNILKELENLENLKVSTKSQTEVQHLLRTYLRYVSERRLKTTELLDLTLT